MNYETLKAAVANVIKTNGNEEITGQLLQDVLIAIINALGSGYQFMGIATAETTPGTPDQRVFYLAGSAGSTALPGFGITVDHEICVLMYSDEWEKQTLLQFDSVLTSGSQNLVTSGMVYDALTNLSQAIDGLAEIVGGHTTAIESLQETVGGHTTAINNLQYAVVAIQAAIESLQTDVAQKIDKSDADSLVVGSAQGVLATSAVEAFFLFQQSGATGNGAALIPTIKGKTRAWNQIIKNNNFATTSNWLANRGTLTVSDNVGTYTITNVASENYGNHLLQEVAIIASHKYFAAVEIKSPSHPVTLAGDIWTATGIDRTIPASSNWTRRAAISSSIRTATVNFYAFIDDASKQVGDSFQMRNPLLIDLTILYGSEISGMTDAQILSKFQAEYPEFYYGYNPGVLKNNDAVAMITDGRNQWDGQYSEMGKYLTNEGVETSSPDNNISSYVKVFPSTAYYLALSSGSTLGNFSAVCWYDADKNFISGQYYLQSTGLLVTSPANAAYFRFSTKKTESEYVFNLSDASFNGTYEPYWSRVLALRLSELTGIPEGGTEADRVTMFPNGLGGAGSAFDSIFVENGVTKAMGTMLSEVDLGDLEWSKGSVFFSAPFPGSKPSGYFISTDPKMIWKTQPTVSGNPGTYEAYIRNNSNLDLYYPLSNYADAAAFKAAMAGVKLLAEAATPIVYTDLQYADGTPFIMPQMFRTAQGGTMLIVSPEGATAPSAPFSADIVYPVDPIASSGASLKNLLEALKTATVITSYTMTFNSTTQQYEFTITK